MCLLVCANLKKLICHDTIVHHWALCPLGGAVAMSIVGTATVVPAGKIVPGQMST